jgi:hypothetical protein
MSTKGETMRCIALTAVFVFTGNVLGQHTEAMADKRPAVLVPGLGEVHHPVSTTNAEAQQFFDQGLRFVFAFNHDEAVRSFRRAAELDPALAMAHWGIALSKGPNINYEVDFEAEKSAYEEAQKALQLAAMAPEQERAYIEALVKRYANDPKADLQKLAVDYKNAMGDLSRRYPDDLDAATLYAESLMDLRPWKFWGPDGKPAEGTEEIVAVLEGVMKRNSNHTGANHYYVHAVEASPHPEWALASAERLKTLAPAAGHLVHMPSHIYIRTGDYEQAARQNEIAAATDREYIKASGAQGMYPMMYYSHNLHFLAVARAIQGRYADAMQAAEALAVHIGPHAKDTTMLPGQALPMLQSFVPTPTLIRIRFRRWDDILEAPAPTVSLSVVLALDHFARGMAQAAKGKVSEAETERQAFLDAGNKWPADPKYARAREAAALLWPVAHGMLDAQIALARNDRKAALGFLQTALAAEDKLPYFEPPVWYQPVRETLGRLLLEDGQPVEAEKLFRAELAVHPRSGRPLFGLVESLKAQGKDYAARLVQIEFDAAWKNADTKLLLKDL